MPDSLLTSFLSALQASVSVLLTIAFGIIAAQFDLISEGPAKEVSTLCVKLFLPALLLTNIGGQLSYESGSRYACVMVWAVTYNVASILLGTICKRFFHFPRWVTPAVTFNNTIAMPLLLLEALGKTGVLEPLLWGAGDDISSALTRAKSYFLVNSIVSDTLTFGIGPKLLGVDDIDAATNDPHGSGKNVSASEIYQAAFNGSVLTEDDPLCAADGEEEQDPIRSRNSNGAIHQSLLNNGGDDDLEEAAIVANEETSLLPHKLVVVTTKLSRRSRRLGRRYWERLPPLVQLPLDWVLAFFSAPLVAAVVGVIIGLTPPLQKAVFAEPTDGGIFTAWLTSSVKNIGELFATLQIVIVGVKLRQSLRNMKHGVESGSVPWPATAFVLFVRFIFWPAISIPLIWLVARKTNVLDLDPFLWFSMMMMPTGPPALGLISLADVAGDHEDNKMSIAKFLTIAYAVSPFMTFIVVGSLKASLATLSSSGIT